MGLLDKASKHSLLGQDVPFGDTDNGAMASAKGPRFADFRNIQFPQHSDPEPHHADIFAPDFDSVLETLLVSDYQYNRGGEPQYQQTIKSAPLRGGTVDLWATQDGSDYRLPTSGPYKPGYRGRDGIGPEDGFYFGG